MTYSLKNKILNYYQFDLYKRSCSARVCDHVTDELGSGTGTGALVHGLTTALPAVGGTQSLSGGVLGPRTGFMVVYCRSCTHLASGTEKSH